MFYTREVRWVFLNIGVGQKEASSSDQGLGNEPPGLGEIETLLSLLFISVANEWESELGVSQDLVGVRDYRDGEYFKREIFNELF